jgi:hypothetical protein
MRTLRDWFASENDLAPTRAERFTLAGGGLAADFSKNRITDKTLDLLSQLAREAGVELGKILGRVVEADMVAADIDETKHDSSTSALIARTRARLRQ